MDVGITEVDVLRVLNGWEVLFLPCIALLGERDGNGEQQAAQEEKYSVRSTVHHGNPFQQKLFLWQ
jgi:hypothetical protein